MKEERPIMLLDVDGVLNVLGNNRHTVRLAKGSREYPKGYPFWPKPITKPFIRWAWANFDVVWNTCWFRRANLIAEWAGVGERPHLGDMGTRYYEDWKLEAAIWHFGRYRTRKIVWVEDGFHTQTWAWALRKPNVLLVRTLSHLGVKKKHVEMIRKFTGVGDFSSQ